MILCCDGLPTLQAIHAASSLSRQRNFGLGSWPDGLSCPDSRWRVGNISSVDVDCQSPFHTDCRSFDLYRKPTHLSIMMPTMPGGSWRWILRVDVNPRLTYPYRSEKTCFLMLKTSVL